MLYIERFRRNNMKKFFKGYLSALIVLSIGLIGACGTAAKGGSQNPSPKLQPQSVNQPMIKTEYKKTKELTAGKPAPTMDSKVMVKDNMNFVEEQGEGVVHNTEDYNHIVENEFLDALKVPLSTFSIDVDTAAYANVRRFLIDRKSVV